mmetsp:Transcript_5651/g.17030  ORF Transcript_5651/g.17030 Transcript_5651/m.17030 type:complete len:204 (+) Transcript_5651:2224-2835(+)
MHGALTRLRRRLLPTAWSRRAAVEACLTTVRIRRHSSSEISPACTLAYRSGASSPDPGPSWHSLRGQCGAPIDSTELTLSHDDTDDTESGRVFSLALCGSIGPSDGVEDRGSCAVKEVRVGDCNSTSTDWATVWRYSDRTFSLRRTIGVARRVNPSCGVVGATAGPASAGPATAAAAASATAALGIKGRRDWTGKSGRAYGEL